MGAPQKAKSVREYGFCYNYRMKQMLMGAGLLILIAVAGFLYRNALERPSGKGIACSLEAKLCPDGSAVGRTGSSCEFAPCPPPNAELSSVGVVFVLPEGYVENKNALGPDSTLIAVYEKPSLSESVPHVIVVRRYEVPAGKDVEDVMIAETIFEPADMGADSIDDLTMLIIDGHVFYKAIVERFEGQIHAIYYFPRPDDLLRFEILERDVTDWMESALVVENLPEHTVFLDMLGTLQSP